MSSTHEFVILGGNFGGLGSAHYLLKHTIPALQRLSPNTKYHVTIVSPSTHFFWKIGAPRILASKTLIPYDKAFLPIVEGFKSYDKSLYTILQGSATALDASTKTVTVTTPSSETKSITYQTLIIATGTTSASALWTLQGSHELSIKAFDETQATLPTASSVLIAGGGPAGVETAGEIATLFPKAELTVLSGADRLLTRLLPGTSADAQRRLEKLGTKVIHNTKVAKASKSDKGYTLELDNGETKVVDLYIDATGGKPNSGFLPASWLDETKRVITDNTLRVTVDGAEGVYAIGDVATYSHGGVLDVKDAVPPLGSSILIDIAKSLGKTEEGEKTASGGGFLSSLWGGGSQKVEPGKQKLFKWLPDSQLIPIGSKQGVGQLFGYRIPSLMVWAIKSRDYMIGNAPPAMNGGDYEKA